MTEATCLARCCECFHLPLDILQVLSKHPECIQDGQYIRDMLVWVSPDYAQIMHRSWGFRNWTPEEGEFYLTCKHWDPKTRLCTDYENRPQMCRDTGVIKPCPFGCGCG